jgi:hypothetical protein
VILLVEPDPTSAAAGTGRRPSAGVVATMPATNCRIVTNCSAGYPRMNSRVAGDRADACRSMPRAKLQVRLDDDPERIASGRITR